MSVQSTFTALAARLALVNPAPQPALVRIYTDPAAAVSLADFPCAIMHLATGPGHDQWGEEGMGLARHGYVISIWIMLGAIGLTPIGELHSRALPWTDAIATTLFQDLTLGHSVFMIGNGDQGTNSMLFGAALVAKDWGDGKYLAWQILLPVIELPNKTMS